jgi:hypothetical protein
MRYWISVLLVIAGVDATAAQQSAGDVYATTGVTFPHQAALDPASPPPFPAPGGWTTGWLVGGGVTLPSQWALEAEVSRTGTMHSNHQGRHDVGEMATRRDWFLSVGLKRSFGLSSRVRVEPIGAIVLVGDEGTYESTFRSAFSHRGYYPVDWVPGVMFGVDFRIGGRHVAVIPGIRFAFSGVPTGTDCVITVSGEPYCREEAQRWQYLHPQWTQRPSLALRVDF